jgi:hypothetical protein
MHPHLPSTYDSSPRRLPAKQIVKFAPWVIERLHLELPAVSKTIRIVRTGRRSPIGRIQSCSCPKRFVRRRSRGERGKSATGRRIRWRPELASRLFRAARVLERQLQISRLREGPDDGCAEGDRIHEPEAKEQH